MNSSEDTTLAARGRGLVSTSISIAIPSGTYARVAARSGLAVKHGIDTGAGVIDSDYRGEVKVLLFNHSDVDFPSKYQMLVVFCWMFPNRFIVKKGDRIAQLIIETIVTPEVSVVEELSETARGAAGFGSTGGFGSSKP